MKTKLQTLVSLLLLLSMASVSNAQAPRLWGVTGGGGTMNYGTIICADSTGTNFHVSYNFDYNNGAMPVGSLCGGGNGKLYGVTYLGGWGDSCVCYDYDTVTEICHNFHNLFQDIDSGWDAMSGMMMASDGMLYGTCGAGGNNGGGVIYRINPATDSYSPLFHMNQATGSYSICPLIQLPDGKLYGTAAYGGLHSGGTIYSFNPTDSSYTDLFDLDSTWGSTPQYGALLLATDGKLYGTTQMGGSHNQGVIYSYDVQHGVYAKLHDFDSIEGYRPMGGLMQANNGMMYGMTYYGGDYNSGSVFRFNPANNAFAVLHHFSGTDGAYPQRELTQASNGKLYGVTSSGGLNNGGVAFSFDIMTDSLTVLKNFSDIGCSNPSCDIIETNAHVQAHNTNVPVVSDIAIQCYPNPATDNITLLGQILNNNSQVEITDMQGRLVSAGSRNGNVINVSMLPAGVYAVKVINGQTLCQGKFVKQ